MTEENKHTYEHPYGGPVRNKFPYGNLIPHSNAQALTTEFAKTWAAPFYREVFKVNSGQEFIEKISRLKDQITKGVVLDLLGDRNWRTRITGAYFAAVKQYIEMQDIIGTHLLRSDLCCAGGGYCITLAAFNTQESVGYLKKYLDYYLSEPELWFEQKSALEAVKYLDKINGTNDLQRYLLNWNRFIENKPYWKEELDTEGIEKIIDDIDKIKRYSR